MQKLNVDEVRNYAVSHTMNECAKYFGKNIKTMRSYCSYHSISAKHETADYDKNKIILFLKNHTVRETAKEFSLSPKLISHLVCRGKLQHRTERNMHGKSHTRLYRIYKLMKDRCYNQHNKCFSLYGERGISICAEWLSDFNAFYSWAISNGYNDTLTIDRIDNDKCYCPENCRWVTQAEQCNNERCNVLITYKGETKTVAQWSKITGIPYATLLYRFHQGKPLDKVFYKGGINNG